VDEVVMLDRQARPVYVGAPNKVRHPALHAYCSFVCMILEALSVCQR